MQFVKEREYICAYDNTRANAFSGKFNILTGQFFNKNGTLSKRWPIAFDDFTLALRSATAIGRAITLYKEHFYHNGTKSEDYTEQRAARLEQFVSLGLSPAHPYDLDSTEHLTKDVVQFCHEAFNGVYDSRRINLMMKYRDMLRNRPVWFTEIVNQYIDDATLPLPFDYIIAFLDRADHEQIGALITDAGTYNDDYYAYNGVKYFITSIMKNYYMMSMELYNTVKIERNLLSTYAQLRYSYRMNYNKNIDKHIQENNDKSFLYFSDGIFEAKPILTAEGFHKEAIAQHNCVERIYMDRVLHGSTYIVTVRYINRPDEPYITCEVDKQGKIVQYLTKFNHDPLEDPAIRFKALYTRHLVKAIAQ